jgi:hypothetical protein
MGAGLAGVGGDFKKRSDESPASALATPRLQHAIAANPNHQPLKRQYQTATVTSAPSSQYGQLEDFSA